MSFFVFGKFVYFSCCVYNYMNLVPRGPLAFPLEYWQ